MTYTQKVGGRTRTCISESAWNGGFAAGAGVLLLVFGLILAGCDDGAQEVTGSVGINYPQVSAPSVTATKTGDGKYLILRWKAVENAGGYTIYSQQEGKVSVATIGDGTYSNQVDYSNDNGMQTENTTDIDQYSYRIELTSFSAAVVGKKNRYGVQTKPSALATGAEGSNAAWTSEYYEIQSSPWLALNGTWIKEGSQNYPRFVIIVSDSTTGSWELSTAMGATPASGQFNPTSIGSNVSFNGYDNSYNYFTVTYNGTQLVVSDLYNNSSGLAGNYIKR